MPSLRFPDRTHVAACLAGISAAAVTEATLTSHARGVPAVRPDPEHVVSNPFGMAVRDVGLLTAVACVAGERELGATIDLIGQV